MSKNVVRETVPSHASLGQRKKIMRLFQCDRDPVQVHRQALLTAQISRSEKAMARFETLIEGDTLTYGVLQLDLIL
jgi:hypothetical protein